MRSSASSSVQGATTRSQPSTNTAARSARASAAFTFCSTSSTVTPEARTSRSLVKTSPTSLGLKPAEGSSRISSRGCAIKARATASI